LAYYPNFAEFALLILSSYGLFAASWWLFQRVSNSRAVVPVWTAALVAFLAFTTFLGVTVTLWQNADEAFAQAMVQYEADYQAAIAGSEPLPQKPVSRTLMLMLYSAALWFFPAIYYARQLVIAFSTRAVQSIAAIEQTEDERGVPFKHARALAMAGDIDGAIARYRGYSENAKEARFEAAQLLESEGRYRDAIDFYIEIGDRYREDIRAWAEAMFRRAKLIESIFGDADGARMLYERILDRAAATEFATLAATQLSRTQTPHEKLLDKLEAGFDYRNAKPEEVITHLPPGAGELQGT
jgi:tetratricopeptide (TPR) repeat protein